MADDKSQTSSVADKKDPHSKVNRILARAAAAKTPEYPLFPASDTTGTLPLSITGRFAKERERLGPEFTEADRMWRVKWHQDQVLHSNEPYYVPELTRSLRNPFRRFYSAPMDYVQNHILTPRIGYEAAWVTRHLVSKLAMAYVGSLFLWYNWKYHHNTWEATTGVKISYNKPTVLPGDPRYPITDPRPEAEDHHDRGFQNRKVFL